MKFNKLFLAWVFTLFSVINVFADPPIPPPDPGDGTGGSGPGSASAPIDMYVFVLLIVAITFIIYYVKKHQKKIA